MNAELRMTSYHVKVAAEAYAAALFAQARCDVSIQYGADQPEYDLIVSRGGQFRKISVKGSRDGGWVLTARYKKDRSYHEAIEAWLESHSDRSVIYCFVQFKGVPFGGVPRVYLAELAEVAEYLRASCGGHGYTSVREDYSWARGKAGGTTDKIPDSWKVSGGRIDHLVPK